jgi:hypothetical protein
MHNAALTSLLTSLALTDLFADKELKDHWKINSQILHFYTLVQVGHGRMVHSYRSGIDVYSYKECQHIVSVIKGINAHGLPKGI